MENLEPQMINLMDAITESNIESLLTKPTPKAHRSSVQELLFDSIIKYLDDDNKEFELSSDRIEYYSKIISMLSNTECEFKTPFNYSKPMLVLGLVGRGKSTPLLSLQKSGLTKIVEFDQIDSEKDLSKLIEYAGNIKYTKIVDSMLDLTVIDNLGKGKENWTEFGVTTNKIETLFDLIYSRYEKNPKYFQTHKVVFVSGLTYDQLIEKFKGNGHYISRFANLFPKENIITLQNQNLRN